MIEEDRDVKREHIKYHTDLMKVVCKDAGVSPSASILYPEGSGRCHIESDTRAES